MSHIYLTIKKPKEPISYAFWFIVCIGSAHASPEDDFRKILSQQVTEEVSDSSIVRDIVEIRFDREFKQWKVAQVHTEQVSQKRDEKNLEKLQERLSYFGRPSTYVGAGTRISIGFQKNINERFGYRFDASGKSTSIHNQQIGVNSYQVKESNASLGGYIDWFPFAGNFRFSAGINLNRINTSASLTGNSTAKINGNNVTTSSESFDINYKFSKISPFVGLGYQSGNVGDYGWSSFADIGLMFGKFNADAKTNLVGQNSVTVSDINYEINTVRGKLFRGNYIATAVVGLKYSY
jgi:hypothetical protein